MFDGGDGVLGVIGSIPPPNTASWVDACLKQQIVRNFHGIRDQNPKDFLWDI